MGTARDSELTRQKIVQAAGQLFAKSGFSAVTVRDIVGRADTHLSALNYHFKSKEGLYREVVLEACTKASISPDYKQQLLRLDPSKALFILVQEYLNKFDNRETSNWQIVIIAREVREPSQVFAEVVQNYLKPETDFVAKILEKIVELPADAHQVRFAVLTMLGLLETFSLYGHLLDEIAPSLAANYKQKGKLAEKIAQLVIEAAQTA